MAAGYTAADRRAIPATGSPRHRGRKWLPVKPGVFETPHPAKTGRTGTRPLGQIGLGAKLGLIAGPRSMRRSCGNSERRVATSLIAPSRQEAEWSERDPQDGACLCLVPCL